MLMLRALSMLKLFCSVAKPGSNGCQNSKKKSSGTHDETGGCVRFALILKKIIIFGRFLTRIAKITTRSNLQTTDHFFEDQERPISSFLGRKMDELFQTLVKLLKGNLCSDVLRALEHASQRFMSMSTVEHMNAQFN